MNNFDVVNVDLRGKNLIEASAGTGKTYSIALLFLRFVLSGIELSEILAVTFTKAATSELKDRVRRFLKDGAYHLKGREIENREIVRIIDDYSESERDDLWSRLERALKEFDEAAIFTIHGFCQRIVRENAFESGAFFDTELVGDQRELVEEVVNDFWRSYLYDAPEDFLEYALLQEKLSTDSLLSLLGNRFTNPALRIEPECGRELLSWERVQTDLFEIKDENGNGYDDLLILKRRLFGEVAERLDVIKRERGAVTFDDLLLIVLEALTGKGKRELKKALRERYKAVLIDEFQDTDPVQYKIFSQLFDDGKTSLFFIGDPKQAIYSFRNADIFAYIKATGAGSIENEKRFTMGVNYRSEKSMVEAVNRLFSERELPFLLPEIEFNPVDSGSSAKPLLEMGIKKGALQLCYLRAEDKPKRYLSRARNYYKAPPILKGGDSKQLMTRFMVAEIQRLIDRKNGVAIGERAVKPGDIAVLTRTNYEATLVKGMLERNGIPAVQSNAGSVFHTREAKEMLRFVQAVVKGDSGLLKNALLTDMFGVPLPEIDRMTREDGTLEVWIEKFREYKEIWQKRGFLSMALVMIRDNGVKGRLFAFDDGERRITNLLHLSELLHREESSRKLNMYETLTFLSESTEEKSVSSEEFELRLESDERAVRILTMHKSKGLEFPIVFCPFLWYSSAADKKRSDSLFYHNSDHDPVLHFGWDEGIAHLCLRENLAENLRLLYVAATRSRNRCYLMWGRIAEAGSSALAYLLHGITSEEEFKPMDENRILSDLARLEGENIDLRYIDGELPGRFVPERDEQLFRPARLFDRELDRSFSITSFSSLALRRGEPDEEPDRDENLPEEQEVQIIEKEPEGIFAFPKGAGPGTALHEIFEEIDFTQDSFSDEVSAVLEKYGYGDGGWEETVEDMVKKVLSSDLGDGLTLDSITLSERISELEFFFKLQDIDAPGLMEILGRYNVKVDFNEVRGFLHGFIDLTFRWNGRFYIVDWKSNYLGPEVSCYGGEALRESMEHHNYMLQYLIYTVALHLYLKNRIPDYDYDSHFGGVKYLFLRGVDGENGIYSDRPERELVEELTQYLTGCERGNS